MLQITGRQLKWPMSYLHPPDKAHRLLGLARICEWASGRVCLSYPAVSSSDARGASSRGAVRVWLVFQGCCPLAERETRALPVVDRLTLPSQKHWRGSTPCCTCVCCCFVPETLPIRQAGRSAPASVVDSAVLLRINMFSLRTLTLDRVLPCTDTLPRWALRGSS